MVTYLHMAVCPILASSAKGESQAGPAAETLEGKIKPVREQRVSDFLDDGFTRLAYWSVSRSTSKANSE